MTRLARTSPTPSGEVDPEVAETPAERGGERAASREIRLCCPLCLGPLEPRAEDLAARTCPDCEAVFPTTPDGLPVLVDLSMTGSPQVTGSDIPRAPLADYAALQTTCLGGLEGTLERPLCPARDRAGPLYRRFVEWPVQRGVRLLGTRHLASARVLHVGPGLGNEALALAPHGARLVGLDIAADFLRCTAENAEERRLPYDSFVVAAAECLPYEDDSFDVVFLHKTVQWWHDADAGLREAYRVGRRTLIVAEPASGRLRQLAQRIGIANETSPVTGRPINEVSLAQLRRALPPTARIQLVRYLGKAIDSAAPRRWVVHLDRWPPLGWIAAAAVAVVNGCLGRLGNQVCAVIEKDTPPA